MANRKCLCCHDEYDFCPNCGTGHLAPAWKSAFCSETCKELWQTLSRFSMNFITKSDAKTVISELDLRPIESYTKCVQRDYAKIMAEENKPKRGRRSEIKIVDEIIDVELEVTDTIVEEPIALVVAHPEEVVEVMAFEPEVYEVVETIENE